MGCVCVCLCVWGGNLFGLHSSAPNFGISLPSHHEKADYLFGPETMSVTVLIRL